MTENMAELEKLNIGVENDDPKTQPTDGLTNTPTDKPECKTIFGREFCLPSLSLDPAVILQGVIEQYLPRIVMVIIGIVLLGIGVWSLT
jgi:hypothetical protein